MARSDSRSAGGALQQLHQTLRREQDLHEERLQPPADRLHGEHDQAEGERHVQLPGGGRHAGRLNKDLCIQVKRGQLQLYRGLV